MNEIDYKALIDTYIRAGKSQVDCAEMLNQLNLNGSLQNALEYLHDSYSILQQDTDPNRYNVTDMGNAERLATKYGQDIRYCYERNKWLIWSGTHWQWDNGDTIMAMAKTVVRKIYAEAADEDDKERRKTLSEHAKRSESKERCNAMIALAQSEPGIPVKASELDRNVWLFNCINGTIDLHTGILREHRRDDLLTAVIPIEYDETAKSDIWDRFLNEITGSNEHLKGYLQKAVGMSLTGDTTGQVLFFLYGQGCNGKSTFLNIIRTMLHEYAMQADPELIMQKEKLRSGGASEDLANLQGKRMVVATEVEEGRKLAVIQIKAWTGGEYLRSRHVYEREIEFKPTFKLWIAGNHKPVITDSTNSIWRRIKLIPFVQIISNPDSSMSTKLEAQYPAILAWAVKGCLDWKQSGIGEPDEVINATNEYRDEQDILSGFLIEKCILSKNVFIAKADLYEAYKKHCEETGEYTVAKKTFTDRIKEKGIIEYRGTHGVREWRGIRLATKDDKNEVTEVTKVTKVTQISPNSSHEMKQLNFTENNATNVTNVTNYPDYPCPICGKDIYWADETGFHCTNCEPPSTEASKHA